MDDISRKFRAVDWGNVKRQVRSMQKATASSLKDMVMTDLENKVRAATNESPWAASGSDLMEIAQASFSREDYALITSILWQRLGSTRWRCVYKALEMLRHLLMHGSSRILDESRAAVTHIEALEHYRSIDPVTRKDDGVNVRRRAKHVAALIRDERLLQEERDANKALRAKLGSSGRNTSGTRIGGISSDDYHYGSGPGPDSGLSRRRSDEDDDGYGGGDDGYRDGGYGRRDDEYGDDGGYDRRRDRQDGRAGGGGYDDAPARRGEPQAGAKAPPSSVDDLLGGGRKRQVRQHRRREGICFSWTAATGTTMTLTRGVWAVAAALGCHRPWPMTSWRPSLRATPPPRRAVRAPVARR